MADDVLLNKVQTIERCLQRIRATLRGDTSRLEDQDVEDIVVLNLLRACEASIDLAMHVVARERLGVPQESREAFALLEAAGALDHDLCLDLQRMVGFRNVAVHQYRQLDRGVLERLLRERLDDFEAFCRAMIARRGS